MKNARNKALNNTVPSATSPPGGGRSSSLPVILSARPRPLSMAPPAFFLSYSIFTSSCVPVFYCIFRALVHGGPKALHSTVPGMANMRTCHPNHLPDACTPAPPRRCPTPKGGQTRAAESKGTPPLVGVWERHTHCHQVSSPQAASRFSAAPSRPVAALPRKCPRSRSRTFRPRPPHTRYVNRLITSSS